MVHNISTPEVKHAAEILQQGQVVALTGAGISVPSGIRPFRGSKGLDNDPDSGIREWRNRETFNKNPAGWYKAFWEAYYQLHNARPNAGHLALRQLVEIDAVTDIVTQNVDGLDLKAGTPEEKLWEIHGHIRNLYCVHCNNALPTKKWLAEHDIIELPVCENDGDVLKPSALLFGPDSVPGLDEIQHCAWEKIGNASSLLVIGASLDLEIAKVYDMVYAFSENGPVIIVNQERTIADAVAEAKIQQNSEAILPQIVELILPKQQNGP